VAVPGHYAVKMTVAGSSTQSQDFEVKMDPRIRGVTVSDLQERFDLALQIRDRVSEANEAVIRIRAIKEEIDSRLEETDDRGIRNTGNEIKEQLSAVEQEIYQVRNRSNQDPLNFPIMLNNKLAALMGVVESGESRPTNQSYAVFEYLSGKLQRELDRMAEIVAGTVGRLNEMLREEGLDPVRSSDSGGLQ
jgi:hypothetical protein